MSGRGKWIWLVAMLTGGAAVGCGSEERVPNAISAQELRHQPRLAEGQRAFMQNCNQCHPGGSSGLGPALNNKKISPFFMRLKVRHHLGTMPGFSEEVLPDAKLDDIIVYLRYVRQNSADLEG